MDLVELYRFAEEQNIAVDFFPMKRAESLSVPIGDKCAIAIDPEKVRSSADEKVKLLHEVGHCVKGAFYNEYAACDVRKKQENKADKWAVEREISTEELDDAVADGCCEMWELAERFNVTEEFMEKAVCWYTYGNLAVEEYMRF